MPPFEPDQEFNCPYCGEVIAMRVDQAGGSRQYLIMDCRVCRRPMQVEVDIDEDGSVNLVAKRDGEG